MNEIIKIELLQENKGQIKGLGKNPRRINDVQLEKLKGSIKESPEILQYRTLLVFPLNGKYVIICGNMRYKACKELGYKEMPCYVLPENTSVQKLKEFCVKDNIDYGVWDDNLILSEDWTDFFKNNEFAMEFFPGIDGEKEKRELAEQEMTEKLCASTDYTIFFNDTTELEKFVDFLTDLEKVYPQIETLPARLIKFIEDNGNRPPSQKQ